MWKLSLSNRSENQTTTRHIYIFIRIIYLKCWSNFQSPLFQILSENLISKKIFDRSKTLYGKSLNNVGFNENLIYYQDNENKNQHKKIKKRQHKIRWSILYFQILWKQILVKSSSSSSTDISPNIIKCLKSLKIWSYSCFRNVGSVIASHNQRVIRPNSNNHEYNCSNRAECTLDNKCLTALW